MLSHSEVYDILGEFVGHKLTTSMGGKRLFQTTTEEQNLNEVGAKVRKEDAKQKTLIINGNFSVEDTKYASLFASMKVIVARYASMNENAGDVTPFQRPCEKDFRDVTAFIMYTLLHEKTHMPRLCQKITLSDVLNPRVTSSGAREIVVHKISLGGPEEVIFWERVARFSPRIQCGHAWANGRR